MESDITKYIKINFSGYKLVESFKYYEIYTVKINNGTVSETLVFDNKFAFLNKLEEPKSDNIPLKTDSAVVIQPMKTDSIAIEEPAKTDSVPEILVEPAKSDTLKQ